MCALVFAVSMLVGWSPTEAAPAGTLTIALSSDISTLDPQMHNVRINYLVGWQLYDNLVTRNQSTLEIIPHLAESWKVVDDHTWEFKLRRGIKFDDGEPFDAESVKFTFERALEAKSPIRSHFAYVKDIRVVDTHTVRIVTQAPYPALLQTVVNFQMLPPKWTRERGQDIATQANGTGPYRLKEWKRGVHVVLEAKSDYWKGAPAIKTVVFRPIKEFATQVSELLTGGVDIVRDVPPDQIAQIEKASNARVSKALGLRVLWIAIDVDGRAGKSPVQSLKVRQAISHAIDVDTIVKTLMGGNAKRTAAGLSPEHFGYDKSLENPYPYDPERAKKLLSEANYPFDQSLKIATYMGSIQNARALVEAIAGYLNAVGIKTSVNVYSDIGMYDRLHREGKLGDLRIHSDGSGGVYDADRLYNMYFRSGNPYVYATFPELDAWIDQARTILDSNTRKALYFKVGKFINDQALIVPLYAQYSILGLSNRVIYEAPRDEFLRPYETKLK